jgi:hypothetical protein
MASRQGTAFSLKAHGHQPVHFLQVCVLSLATHTSNGSYASTPQQSATLFKPLYISSDACDP